MRLLQITLIATAILCKTNLPLAADIQKATVTWNNVACQKECGHLLEKWLKEIKGVAEVRMNWQSGYADLIWKPGSPFDYYPVHAAMARVGVYMQNLRLQLRGTINHSGRDFYITSLGDNTKVQILGSLVSTSAHQYVEANNPQSYKVDDAMRKKLLDAESNNQLVTIDGTLFEPWRPPLKILPSSIKVESD